MESVSASWFETLLATQIYFIRHFCSVLLCPVGSESFSPRESLRPRQSSGYKLCAEFSQPLVWLVHDFNQRSNCWSKQSACGIRKITYQRITKANRLPYDLFARIVRRSCANHSTHKIKAEACDGSGQIIMEHEMWILHGITCHTIRLFYTRSVQLFA